MAVMAKTVAVVVTDDLDGSSSADTVKFGFDGVVYEIDLSEKNRAKFQDVIAPYIEAGRRTGRNRIRPASRQAGQRTDSAAVRAWAGEHGLHVSERGRISANVLARYEAAH
jgi:hypothetical protein